MNNNNNNTNIATRHANTSDCCNPRAAAPGSIRQIVESFWGEPFFVNVSGRNSSELATPLALPVDIAEVDNTIVVTASLPGYKKDQVNIEIHEGELTISAAFDESSDVTQGTVHRRERRTGSVMRRIALPTDVKSDEAQAELVDGVLTIRVPQADEVRPRKVNIT
ncbi:MAG: Hsp20/alpha crystallin family protein [Phycisphaerales bacterium]